MEDAVIAAALADRAARAGGGARTGEDREDIADAGPTGRDPNSDNGAVRAEAAGSEGRNA
jgi:hypothetical protein